MSDLDIVGLGMANLDVLLRLKDMPTWQRGTTFGGFGIDGGGPAGTACVAAARLGARVGFVGTAGNDLAAELKLRSFVENGVDLSHLVRRNRPENQIILACVDEETGERVFSGLRDLLVDPLQVEELDHEYIASAEYLHLDGFHSEAALVAAEWMQSAGKQVSLDAAATSPTVPLEVFWRQLVRHVDILICGSGFAQALTGQSDIWDACRAALELGPRIVVQTEGSDGSYTVTAGEQIHTPAFAVKVVDTTGAGDVFHGAFLAAFARGWDLQRTVLFATAAAALECTRLGGRVGIPRYEQVIVFLNERVPGFLQVAGGHQP